MGTNPEEVQRRFRGAVAELRKAGLTVHEEEEFEVETKILGWEYDQVGVFRPGHKRVWRVRKAIRYLLQIGRASGQQLEQLLGHMTFISLGRRETLSIFGEIYTFIRRHYRQVVPLWKSVRRELEVWDGLSPLILQNLRSAWGRQICSVDASEWGLGVCVAEIEDGVASSLSRYNERWRFRAGRANRARAFVEEEARSKLQWYAVDEEPVGKVEGGDFQSVPFEVVDREWTVVGRHRWKYLETMPVYEARSTLHAVRHLLRNSENFGKRHVVLSDSMTAILAYSKGRAHTHRLRRVAQQTSAYVLASGSNVYVRWVPSEWNPADHPSRGRRSASIPQKHLGDGPLQELGSTSDMAREGSPGREKAEGAVSAKSTHMSSAKHVEFGASRDDPSAEEKKESCPSTSPCSSRGSASRQYTPSRSIGKSGDKTALPEADEGLCGLEEAEPLQGQRPGAHCLPPRAVSERRRSVSGQLRGGSSTPPSSRTSRERLSSKSTTVIEGLAEAMSPKEQNASSLRGNLLGGCYGHPAGQSAGGSGDVVDLLPLSQTNRVPTPSSAGHCEAGQEGGKGLPILECSPSPLGGGATVKSSTVGRGFDHGPRTYGKPWTCHRQDTSVGKPKQERSSLQCDKHRCEQSPQQHVATAASRKLGSSTHVPPATRRCNLRTGKWIEEPSGGAAAGSLEGPQEPEKLREGRKIGTVVRKPKRASAKAVCRGQSANSSSAPQPALSIKASLKFPVFLEVFSGTGRLGKAVSRYAGMPVLLWDITYGPEYDLTKPAVQRLVLGWIQNGSVVAGHLGTPCHSFSRARDRPGGPPRLRSDSQPLGLDGLKPWDEAKVRQGNCLMRFTVRVLLLALAMVLPFTLENPARSRLWICPPVVALLRRKFVTCQLVEYCMFGMPWKKSTMFLGVHLSLVRLSPFRCIGAKRGLCKCSNKPHVPLAGQTPDGRWLTHIAEPYPPQLCKLVAGCFHDFQVATIAKNFSKHLMI